MSANQGLPLCIGIGNWHRSTPSGLERSLEPTRVHTHTIAALVYPSPIPGSRQTASIIQTAVQANAGVGTPSRVPTADYTAEQWDYVLSINLKGVWLCMKYEIPQMLKHGGGAIVNTASVAGLVGFPTSSAYVASKHGVVGLTKQRRWNTLVMAFVSIVSVQGTSKRL